MTINANIITNSTTLTPVQLSKVQYLDISSSLTTQLTSKQNLITSSTDLVVNSLNTISSTNLSKIQYLDISSSLTTQLTNKQPLINSSTDLIVKSLNGLSSTTLGYIDATSSIQTQLSIIKENTNVIF